MTAIGLIIGHGYAKAYSDTSKMARFPALAAPASAAGYEDAQTGRGPHLINGWLVGEEAQTFAPTRLVSILDKSRYSDPSFVAMARYAISQVADGLHLIMSGMPSAWFDDLTARQVLEDALREAATPWGTVAVKIAPEAAGVFYAYCGDPTKLGKKI